MIAVERLTTVLRVIAVSDMVPNAHPISATLIAPSDAGKSALLTHTLPASARVINDFTTASMTTLLADQHPPKRIVVPDFNQVISHKPSVSALAMAFLLALLAEGITEIPGVDEKAKLLAKNFKKRGLRIALLTGMTPEMFHSRRGKWRAIGLLRRLVPVYYTYSQDTAEEIQSSIQRGIDQLDYTFSHQKKLKSRPVSVNEKISQQVKSLSQFVVDNQLVWNRRSGDGRTFVEKGHEFPFSLHKIFRSYVKAHALLNNRTNATRADFDALKDFSKFVRYDRPEEL